MPYAIANSQLTHPIPIAQDEFYVPPSPRTGAWAREQASRVASQRISRPGPQLAHAHKEPLSIEQATSLWRQKRLGIQALVSQRTTTMSTPAASLSPPMPTRAAPVAPPVQLQPLPTFHITPAPPQRVPPPVPMASQPVQTLAHKPSQTWSINSYEKMLIEDLEGMVWETEDAKPQAVCAPPSPPLTLVTSGESQVAADKRRRGQSFSDASLTISSPSSGGQSDWSAAHTDDGHPAIIVGDHIIVAGESYPLRYGLRGIVTYYHPIRMRQILVHMGETEHPSYLKRDGISRHE